MLNNIKLTDRFFGNRYDVLWDRSELLKFAPSTTMSATDNLNASARLMIYVSLICALLYSNILIMILPIVIIVAIHVMYKSNLESGNIEGFLGDIKPVMHPIVELDDEGHVKQIPTPDNPFMNVLLTDYVERPTRPPAKDITDPKVSQQVDTNFNIGLYTNINNVFDRNNSQRQYVTNPATIIPNDRKAFMDYCYDTPYVFKDGDQFAAPKIFEEPRRHGAI